MSEEKTIEWYDQFWYMLNIWLSEMAAKKVRRVYVMNYDFVPEDINKAVFMELFNEDSNSWELTLDEESDLVCVCKEK